MDYNVPSYNAPTYLTEETLPPQYRPLSPWAYFGYNLLFSIPILGFILLIVFALSDSNINRRNYARSFFIVLLFVLIITIIMLILFFVFGYQADLPFDLP